jgi:uncharacterized protein YfaT (DUF1175 family)
LSPFVSAGSNPVLQRRSLLALLASSQMAGAWGLTSALPDGANAPLVANRVVLDGPQSDFFRAWMTLVVADQIQRGPSPRWSHRDCAGLVRFAVREAFRRHDARWVRANSIAVRNLPPELVLRAEQEPLRAGWVAGDGSVQDYVGAFALIAHNSRPLGKEVAMARPGDLLFFDQGNDQHLMVWMGRWIGYHNGQTPVYANAVEPKVPKVPKRSAQPPLKPQSPQLPQSPQDNGLRAVTLAQLLQWKDTRWRPQEDNPNFVGFFRLAFLSR